MAYVPNAPVGRQTVAGQLGQHNGVFFDTAPLPAKNAGHLPDRGWLMERFDERIWTT